jgi:membrane-associated protein
MQISDVISLITDFDKHLDTFVDAHGAWTYLLSSVIVFAETGFVVLPFLPGDSLLFALGAISARVSANPEEGHLLNLFALMGWLTLAAVLGNTVNYAIGRRVGLAAVRSGKVKFVKQSHLDRTHAFFEKHGGKAVVISRFVPIIRTVAPFVAGAGQMNFVRFQVYNVLGAALWVVACCVGGYFFGNIPFVREHFSMVVLFIIAASMIPVVISAVQMRRESREQGAASKSEGAPVAHAPAPAPEIKPATGSGSPSGERASERSAA